MLLVATSSDVLALAAQNGLNLGTSRTNLRILTISFECQKTKKFLQYATYQDGGLAWQGRLAHCIAGVLLPHLQQLQLSDTGQRMQRNYTGPWVILK